MRLVTCMATNLAQQTEWRAATMLMAFGVIEGHEFTQQGGTEATERLTEWGVPGWAMMLRFTLLSHGSDLVEPWQPTFAIRSEAALTGISALAPDKSDREQAYQRVFLRFMVGALRPFASPGPLRALYECCEAFSPAANSREWQELWAAFEDQAGLEQCDEAFHALDLALALLQEMRAVLYPLPRLLSDSGAATDLPGMVARLNRQHQWRLEGRAGQTFAHGASYTRLIADAYLAALEAECPAPECLLSSPCLSSVSTTF